MPPRPSTSRRGVLQNTALTAHSDSHDINGDDPVLGSVLYHGTVSVASYQETSGAFADTGLELPNVNSRGGKLYIQLFTRVVMTNDTTEESAQVEIKAVVDSTSLTIYFSSISAETPTSGPEPGTLRLGTPTTMSWIYDTLPGNYSVKIQAKKDYGTVFLLDATMMVLELLPLRRG